MSNNNEMWYSNKTNNFLPIFLRGKLWTPGSGDRWPDHNVTSLHRARSRVASYCSRARCWGFWWQPENMACLQNPTGTLDGLNQKKKKHWRGSLITSSLALDGPYFCFNPKLEQHDYYQAATAAAKFEARKQAKLRAKRSQDTMHDDELNCNARARN